MNKPLKVAMTVADQVELLRARGIEVDATLAEQWLAHVSYYRLSGYWYPARIPQAPDRRSDRFEQGTTFADVVRLYEADRKLRTVVHDGMERIEVAMRTRVGEQLYSSGPLGYQDATRFRPTFDHARWMSTAARRIDRAAAHNESIRHYQVEYGGAYPFWVLAEVLDFADVSRLYDGMTVSDQREIAESLGLRIDMAALSRNQQRKTKERSPLARWMEQLTIVRNPCAHHGRLWNKSFTPAPTAALRTQEAFV